MKYIIFSSLFCISLLGMLFVAYRFLDKKRQDRHVNQRFSVSEPIGENDSDSKVISSEKEVASEVLVAEQKSRERFLQGYYERRYGYGQLQKTEVEQIVANPPSGNVSNDFTALNPPQDAQMAYSETHNSGQSPMTFEEARAKQEAALPVSKAAQRTVQTAAVQTSGRQVSTAERMGRLEKEFARRFGKSRRASAARRAQAASQTVAGAPQATPAASSILSSPDLIGGVPSLSSIDNAIIENTWINKTPSAPVNVKDTKSDSQTK